MSCASPAIPVVTASGPLAHYRRHVESGRLSRDPAQQQVVPHLERIYRELLRSESRPGFFRARAPARQVKGLYLWGGVGRGKTYLMDLLGECLGELPGRRFHFLEFMRSVHQELRALGDIADPLPKVAHHLMGEARLLCLDEFQVTDIVDAMLLGGLMACFFGRGVTLVATSNVAPRDLYADGLQRDRFLPAIDLLEGHLEVIHLAGEQDYRALAWRRLASENHPLSAATHGASDLAAIFDRLSGGEGGAGVINANARALATLGHASDVLWCECAELCGSPPGQAPLSTPEYLWIAQRYHTLLLANVPVLGEAEQETARRLLHLIDIAYGHGMRVVMETAVPVTELYQGNRLAFEFQRATSRLLEMLTPEWMGEAAGRRHR